MNQNISENTSEESLHWDEIWIRAITKPNELNYKEIINSPKTTITRACIWIFITGMFAFICSLGIQILFSELFGINTSFENSKLFDSNNTNLLIILICGAPIYAILSVLGLLINSGLSHIMAKILGGTGSYGKLTFAIASYLAPIMIITSIIGSIPIVSCLGIPIAIYTIVLNVIAIKATYEFGWGKAFASSCLLYILILLVVSILVIIILALLGPAIGNVFSTIIEKLPTPTP